MDAGTDAENWHQLTVLGSGEQWLFPVPEEGLLAASDAQNVQITFDATNLTAGTYQTDLRLISNDLGNSVLAIPCELSVLGSADIQTFPSTLAFGQLMVGTTGSRTLQIAHTGTDTLFIDSMTPF